LTQRLELSKQAPSAKNISTQSLRTSETQLKIAKKLAVVEWTRISKDKNEAWGQPLVVEFKDFIEALLGQPIEGAPEQRTIPATVPFWRMSIAAAQLHQEGELLELHGQVHSHKADARGQPDHGGREVEDPADAGRDQPVGHFLGGLGGDGEQAQFRTRGRHHLGHSLGRVDFQAVDPLAALGGVGVEQGDDAKAALREATVAQQGPGQVAHPHEHRRPFPVDSQGTPDGLDQFARRIADPRLAQVTERSQVLADLGVGDSERLAQLSAGDSRRPLALEPLEATEVEAEPADAGAREA
jgi:hypothetical protein